MNTTSWPPADAGFGENDCAPFWRVMLIVTALVVPGVVVVVDDFPPHADAAMAEVTIARIRNRARMLSLRLSRCTDAWEQDEYQRDHAQDVNFPRTRLTAGVSRYESRPRLRLRTEGVRL